NRFLAFLDIGGRPDRMERFVQSKPRIDIAWKFVRFGDNRFERSPNESVAVRLAAGQSTSVAAKKRQVRCKFLTKGHIRSFSLECINLRRLWRRVRIVATLEGPSTQVFSAPQRCEPHWNKGPAIWFPPAGPGVAATPKRTGQRPSLVYWSGALPKQPVAPLSEMIMSAPVPAPGGTKS